MKKDLFGYTTQGKKYDTYRPKYPKNLLSSVLSKTSKKQNYLDIATGTGQLLFEICHNFNYSLGIDISQNMINVCKQKLKQSKIENVEVRCQDVMNIQNVGKLYDLITIGQALHWLPVREVLVRGREMLAPGGVFAVYGYVLNDVKLKNSEQDLQTMYYKFYDKKVKGNFDFDRNQLHSHYKDPIRYPFNQIFPKTLRQQIQIPIPMTKQSFLAYLRTYSGYNTYLQRYSPEDPIKEMEENLREDADIQALFDYFVVIGEL